MEVRCPKCATVFEFDERQMRGAVATLKCSVCQHLFRLETTTSIQENHSRWMVRDRLSGDVRYFSGFDVLHRWILEGKTKQQDEISRTGKRWTALADVGEFMPIFQVVESINHLSRGVPEAASLPSLPDSPTTEAQTVADAARPRQPTMQQFANPGVLDSMANAGEATVEFSRDEKLARLEQAHAPQPAQQAPQPTPQRELRLPPSPTGPLPRVQARQPQQPTPRTPEPVPEPSPPQKEERVRLDTRMTGQAGGSDSWANGDEWSLGDMSAISGKFDAVDADEDLAIEPEKKRSLGPVIFGVLLLALIAGGGYAWMFERDRVMALLESSTTTTPAVAREADGEDVKETSPPVEKSAEEHAQGELHAALDAASGALGVAHGKLLDEAIVGARGPFGEALEAAEKRAVRHAKRSDIDSVLKDASRALDRGNAEKARELFNKALDLDNRNLDAITGLGWSLLSLGRTASASVQFRRAISINSSHQDAYIGLGKAERSKGNLQEALNVYEGYLSRFPGGRKASIARHQRDEIRKALGM